MSRCAPARRHNQGVVLAIGGVGDVVAPSAVAAFLALFWSTQRIAPYRPPPTEMPWIAVTPIFAAASFDSSSCIAPSRSSPCTRNAFLGRLSLILAALAAARNDAESDGTKSTCIFRLLGNAESASRLVRASRSIPSRRAPSPTLSGVVV